MPPPGRSIIDDNPIQPVYPLEYAIALASGGSLLRSLGSAIIMQFLPDTSTQYTYTQTAQNHAASWPYLNSLLTVQQIIRKGVPEPGGLPGALRYDVPGTFNGSQGTYDLVIEPKTNKIYHFLFEGGQ